MKLKNTLSLVAAACLASACLAGDGPSFAIEWYTIDGGGGTSTGGTLSVSGTIGQWDAGPPSGPLAGESLAITGGFWVGSSPQICAADFNEDGELNADDLGDYINCYFASPACPDVDFNHDGDINADDLGDMINAYFAGC